MTDTALSPVTLAVPPLELGHHLALIRERAEIKQAELAKLVTWSPAVLSRVESGERPLAVDELNQLINAIGTPAAKLLGAQIRHQWKILPRPPLDHEDHDALWAAEEVAQRLEELRNQPDVKHAFESRLTAYLNDIKSTATLLLNRKHQIAFVGNIGIGKSTAICRLTGLEVPSKAAPRPDPVLKAGAGGTTICEVHIYQGPQYGISIEPRSEDEIRADVMEFANYLRGDFEQQHDDEGQGISKEVERAIRSLADLHMVSEKASDGKRTRKDPAKDLAQNFKTARELCVELLTRMELHRRDQREIWYEASSGKPPFEWLRENFAKINDGRHETFTLPKRIDVIVPDRILAMQELAVRIVDTKGIDGTAARADLEDLLDDPHTLVVLCSGFNDAPAPILQGLLKRAQEAGVRNLTDRASILVLPHPGQAQAVNVDATGDRVESVEEGYEHKQHQAAQRLQPMRLDSLRIGFFNSYEDDPQRARDFLTSGIKNARQTFKERLKQVTQDASTVLDNHMEQQLQAVMEQAGNLLRANLKIIGKVDFKGAQLQDSLLGTLSSAHAATIRATLVREGEWYNLNYSHHLGHGARRMAAAALEKSVESFSNICQTMLEDDDYAEVKELITLTDRVLQDSYSELLRKLQLMGQAVYQDTLKTDSQFWASGVLQWGRGPGYRDRITSLNEEWFEDEGRQPIEDDIRRMIQEGWTQALARVSSLLEVTSTATV